MARPKDHFRVQVECDTAIRLELLGYLETEPSFVGLRHSHSFWELVYLAHGRGTLHYGEEAVEVKSGDIWLLEPAEEHQFISTFSGRSRQIFAGFTVGGDFPADWARNLSPPMLSKKETLPIANDLDDIVARIRPEEAQADLQACAADVLAVLLRFLSGQVYGAGPADHAGRSGLVVEKAKQQLAANLDTPMSVSQLAASFYLSPHYFGDLFKQQTGMTIKDFHHTLRLRKAEEMLLDPALSVSEIADTLGYSSIHYFSRRFKQQYGVSPTAFRTTVHPTHIPSETP